jgi:hypothetical protein
MSLKKRHIGRRVAGVGVGVALLVLGLEAPAFAAPAVTGISPTSGKVGCVVVITGTGFDQPGAFAVSTVKFTGATINSVTAPFHVVSDTEIWTTVPATAATGAITVSDGETPPATSNSPVFTVTTGGDAGGCAATIASFTPVCGVVGTPVTITGTNLLASSGDDSTTPVTPPAGGNVKFNPYTTNAVHTGVAETPTTLSVNVPAGALDGPIQVNTPAGPAATSTDSFNVVTDPTECGAVTVDHPRSITFKLKKSGKASGVVSSTEDPAFTDCVASVPVKIQKKKKGDGWKTVKTATTSDTGSYSAKVRNKKGKQKFRALAPKVSLGTPAGDTCLKAKSATRTI